MEPTHLCRIWEATLFTNMSNPSRSWTPRSFFARFTPQEKTAIYTAAVGNAALLQMLFEFTMSERIRSDHPDLEPGMQALVNAGLISLQRKEQILDVTL